MKSCVDKGMTEAEICEKYSDCDQDKIKLMASKCSKMNEDGQDGRVKYVINAKTARTKTVKNVLSAAELDIRGLAEESEEKVEETTSGSIAPAEAGGQTIVCRMQAYMKATKLLNVQPN